MIGINFEDRVVKGSGLYDIGRQADRIATVRETAEERGVELFINARTDLFLGQGRNEAQSVGEALDRAKAYAAAGASGFFIPGLKEDALIGRILRERHDAGQRDGHERGAVQWPPDLMAVLQQEAKRVLS